MAMGTPSTQLATLIVERLIKEGLLREGDRKATLPKLADGELKQEDWRLAVELSIAKDVKK
jgi:hypothetical protein